MYSVHDHGAMIADPVRVAAYRQALAHVLKPGAVVVDIGTGVGLLAVFACQLGARKVYAIECEEVIELAQQVARDNACAERIQFIRDLSTNVELPEKADVIVSDLHGALPMFSRGLETLIDARRRLLAPHGTMVPFRDRVGCAVVNLPDKTYDKIAVWRDRRWDVDLTAGARFGFDWPIPTALRSADLVTPPQCLATLDYSILESPSVNSDLGWNIPADGAANGYGIWFDCDLAEGISLTTAPGAPETVYPNQFAPWSHSLPLRRNDRIEAHFSFQFVHDRYFWVWSTRILSPTDKLLEEFRQSSLSTMFVSTGQLRRRAPAYRPRLQSNGITARVILELMDGQRSHQEIARLVMQRCPGVFHDEQSALQAVSDISVQFGE